MVFRYSLLRPYVSTAAQARQCAAFAIGQQPPQSARCLDPRPPLTHAHPDTTPPMRCRPTCPQPWRLHARGEACSARSCCRGRRGGAGGRLGGGGGSGLARVALPAARGHDPASRRRSSGQGGTPRPRCGWGFERPPGRAHSPSGRRLQAPGTPLLPPSRRAARKLGPGCCRSPAATPRPRRLLGPHHTRGELDQRDRAAQLTRAEAAAPPPHWLQGAAASCAAARQSVAHAAEKLWRRRWLRKPSTCACICLSLPALLLRRASPCP